MNNTNSYSNKIPQFDSGKYVELYIFNEFKKDIHRELDGIHLNISDLKKLIEEIMNLLNNKASVKDLKSLEGIELN